MIMRKKRDKACCFRMWMMNNQTEPYNSFGNGSAMRVSHVGWFASSLEECETVADFL